MADRRERRRPARLARVGHARRRDRSRALRPARGRARATTPRPPSGSAARSRGCGSSRTSDGRFDRSLLDTGGEALVVCQFTLIADTQHGQPAELLRRGAGPSWPSRSTSGSAPRSAALGVPVETGVFGARMAGRARERRPGDDRPRDLSGRERPEVRSSATLRTPHFGQVEMGARRPFFVEGAVCREVAVWQRAAREGERTVSRGRPHGRIGAAGRRGARARDHRARSASASTSTTRRASTTRSASGSADVLRPYLDATRSRSPHRASSGRCAPARISSAPWAGRCA